MHVLVCGWLGSTNLGDELVFRGLLHLLGGDAEVTAVSTAPATTREVHGVAAVDHRRLDLIARAARESDLVVFGGGGLVQDETSPFNLPYHLSRVWTATRVATPWVGIGLGVGPLRTRTGRGLARTLASARALTVRDTHSRRVLAGIGVHALLGADTAFHLAACTPVATGDDPARADTPRGGAPPRVEAEATGRHLAVALRPWTTERSRRPVGWRGTPAIAPWFVPTVAAALDRTRARTGLDIELVALQTDRDQQLHREVARAMRSPVRLVVPSVDDVVAVLGRARAVVAMRYHAGVAATLTGRPSVLVGYSPKVTSLAGELGSGAVHLPFDPLALTTLDRQVEVLLRRPDATIAVAEALRRLSARAMVNREAIMRGSAPDRLGGRG